MIRLSKLYLLEDDYDKTSVPAYSTKTLEEWHRTLRHMSNDISQLPNCTRGMNIGKSVGNSQPHTTCGKDKATRNYDFADDLIHATRPLERVHTDIWTNISHIS